MKSGVAWRREGALAAGQRRARVNEDFVCLSSARTGVFAVFWAALWLGQPTRARPPDRERIVNRVERATRRHSAHGLARRERPSLPLPAGPRLSFLRALATRFRRNPSLPRECPSVCAACARLEAQGDRTKRFSALTAPAIGSLVRAVPPRSYRWYDAWAWRAARRRDAPWRLGAPTWEGQQSRLARRSAPCPPSLARRSRERAHPAGAGSWSPTEPGHRELSGDLLISHARHEGEQGMHCTARLPRHAERGCRGALSKESQGGVGGIEGGRGQTREGGVCS